MNGKWLFARIAGRKHYQKREVVSSFARNAGRKKDFSDLLNFATQTA
jgi:hypothetical protein